MRFTDLSPGEYGNQVGTERTAAKLIRTDQCVGGEDDDPHDSRERPDLDDLEGRSATGAWRLDVDTGRLWWSAELYEIMNVDPATFTPSIETVPRLFEAADRQRVRDRGTGLCRSPESFHELYGHLRPDGELRVIEVRGWVVDADEQPPRHIMGICRDTTQAPVLAPERAQLARGQAARLALFDDGICGLDDAGQITFANAALRRLTGREGETLLGARLHDLVHRDRDGTESHAFPTCPFTTSPRGGEWAIDPAFRRRDGSKLVVGYASADQALAPATGPDSGVVIALRDLTGQYAAFALLQPSLRQLQTLGTQLEAARGHLAQAEERERLRIAAEIHDDPVQALDAVALRLSNVGELLEADDERDRFVDAEIEVRAVAERLRQLMFGLMPPPDGRDLRDAVRSYCSVLFAQSPMRWEIAGDAGGAGGAGEAGEAGETLSDSHLVAYRLIQEALRNALAHSQGTRVEVRLEETDSELRVRVSDDGQGINRRASALTHAGMRIIRQRAQAAGGSAEFTVGLEGRGTALVVRLPVSLRAR